MKRVSIQDLKAQLSAAIREAESGTTIIITRHNEPVAQLGPARPPHVHRGKSVGTERITPALRRGTKGRYLAALMEDRATVEPDPEGPPGACGYVWVILLNGQRT